ncbi:MAG TPA: IS1182 family transposase [Jiangellales bacterium]|nr:IS1182 family transposase [Jiangellales bacterium]
MSLGLADRQIDLLDDVTRFCDETLPESSIYRLLHVERDRLFPDEMFADLFKDTGRRCVPPSVVATVMVLQRLEGLSDRDAVERYAFDTRWRYAAGVGGYDCAGWDRFAHTVLVDFRARLARSDDPLRIFHVTLDAASKAGLVGPKRVLDSTPLYDAVATMDTITLIRSAIRGLLRVADADLQAELRQVMSGIDDYASTAKPGIDWDDRAAREALVDTRARDGYACLAALDGRDLAGPVAQAMQLLATVLGQDLETGEDGVLRIARRVAKDRIISTVDPETRHGHKTSSRSFDGFKGHVAIDPDSEIITDTEVTAGNVGDGAAAADLIDDLLDRQPIDGAEDTGVGDRERPTVYGDNAYGTGELHDLLADNDITDRFKTQTPTAPQGRFPKDRFTVDLDADTVTCPNGVTVEIRRNKAGHGEANFGTACSECPLRAQCTDARNGRSIKVSRHERRLAKARADQKNPKWKADYQATRPKVERKFGHLMRHRHGGRRARMRGNTKIAADFNLLAAAHNLARLGRLGLHYAFGGWAVATA